MPTDVITPFTELNVLQIVFMAAVAGIAALQLGEKAQPVLTLSESVLELLQKALWWVIRLAPLGTVGLIGTAVATYGWDLIGQYATFTADIYAGCAIVLFVVYPALLATVAKASPLRFFKGAWPPSSWPSSPARPWAPCRSPRRSPSGSGCRASTRPSRCRSARRPRWTAAPRSTPPSPRSSSRRSSTSGSASATTC
ncbi:hypothetical protein GCM10020295_33800 [Streptomyces cinereospinus]